MRNDELYHYGVKGQKWGVRRARASGGTVSRKQAKKEYRQDNKTAFEYGKHATISGKALSKSMSRTAKLESKANKLSNSGSKNRNKIERAERKLRASKQTNAQLADAYTKHRDTAIAHQKSLVNKYGKEAVSNIKYKNSKSGKTSLTIVNERVNKLSDYAKAGAVTVASLAAMRSLGAPMGVLVITASANKQAARAEAAAYHYNYATLKPKRNK